MSFINVDASYFKISCLAEGIYILNVPQAWGLIRPLMGELRYSSLQLRTQSSFLCSTRVWKTRNELYDTCSVIMVFPDTVAGSFKLNDNHQGWFENDGIRLWTHHLTFPVRQKLEIRLERHFRCIQELCRVWAAWLRRSGTVMVREGVNWWDVIAILFEFLVMMMFYWAMVAEPYNLLNFSKIFNFFTNHPPTPDDK